MEWWKKKKKKKKKKKARAYDKKVRLIGAKLLEEVIECCDGKSNPIKFFSPDQILEATDNFSNSNHIFPVWVSGFEWYSGKNEKHPMILIRRCSNSRLYNSRRGEEGFCRDIAISSMVSGQKNFLKLVGCCLESEEPVMVYHGVKKHYELDLRGQPWIRRIKIAEDIATALAYLHTAFPRPFVYRSMSLGKFLLDEDGVAKLWDFSCRVSIPEGETFVQVDSVAGTYDYMDHNYSVYGLVSEKTDVFAFGIVMLELLTGERRFRKTKEEGYKTDLEIKLPPEIKLPNWVSKSKLFKEPRLDVIADPMMGGISKQEICRMEAFLMLSKRCIGLSGEVPAMMEVARELRMIQTSPSSSPSGETQLDSAQDISFSLLSNQTSNT
uniref:Inactive serine/threonine-protein kinase n=1 Tax=Noccaea caerulescens TaxID=107243 RepID=A0A1J3DQ73_NOCCA